MVQVANFSLLTVHNVQLIVDMQTLEREREREGDKRQREREKEIRDRHREREHYVQ